jgi:hypothetical protein
MTQDISDTELMKEVVPESVGAPGSASANNDCGTTGSPDPDRDAADSETSVRRLKDLPREFGVMLVSVGALGVVLPGLMGAPALAAGGLVLWPSAFGGFEDWLKRRNPRLHQRGMQQVGRFLDDLERRYPVATEA